MSRSRNPVSRKRAPIPVLVIVILLLRTAVFVSLVGLAGVMLIQGVELSVVASSIALLAATAAAAATTITRNTTHTAIER
ncbi:hypothetical protein [Kribbella monticola]|uniref:hypothetical protein n=1 Tax=Kribbella monticola TaxID=2185285 RepID=UPI00130069AD|nr:hypothetical protein [Kribbella monticola]